MTTTMTTTLKTLALATACAFAFGSATVAHADDDRAEDMQDAQETLQDAATVLNKMSADANLLPALRSAHGVFVVPDYARVAFGVGGRGGEGVLLVQKDGKWTNPAFYNFGGVSAGLEAGVEAGEIAMVLQTKEALDSFMQQNNWSLNADAGLTVINWSAKAQGSIGKGDVIVWSDTEGLLGDLSVSLTDINFDEDETAAYYGQNVTREAIFSGTVKAPAAVAVIEID